MAWLMDMLADYVNERRTKLPVPFLQRPIIDAPVSAGWDYTEEEVQRNGVSGHGAIDFLAPRGTLVRAAAAGWAMATWQEYPVFRPDGTRHTFGHEPVWFGAGLFVQILHDNGWYTQYCHLQETNSIVPYLAGGQFGSGNRRRWEPSSYLRQTTRLYRSGRGAIRVQGGQPIGQVGMTGCGVGRPSYPDWDDRQEYTQIDADHLHFVVFGPRAPRTRNAKRVDPFGLYQQADAYPKPDEDWFKLPYTLWRPQSS